MGQVHYGIGVIGAICLCFALPAPAGQGFSVGLSGWLAEPLLADILPAGHKSVRHQLVFEPSPLFAAHRVVAAPTRGFAGVAEIKPGERFSFSSKYGTRIYLVPPATPVESFDREQFQQWPSALPPIRELNSVPIWHPLAQVVTTLRLLDVSDAGPTMEVVKSEQFNGSGGPVSFVPLGLATGGVALVGLAICGIVWRRTRRRSGSTDAKTVPMAETTR
jgi:hypothetical protein